MLITNIIQFRWQCLFVCTFAFFFLTVTAHSLPCLSFLSPFVILEVFLETTWMQKPPAACETNRLALHLLTDSGQARLTLSRVRTLFYSPSHNKSCFSLAAFSSALVSVNRGPHNSSMHHWPQWIILCLTDSTTRLTTTLCHTQIESAWWITQWIMMDYKTGIHIKTHKQSLAQPYQQTLWFAAGWDHIFLGLTGLLIRADAHRHHFICLTQVASFSLRCSGENRDENSRRCHRLLLLSVTLNLLLWQRCAFPFTSSSSLRLLFIFLLFGQFIADMQRIRSWLT